MKTEVALMEKKSMQMEQAFQLMKEDFMNLKDFYDRDFDF